jgi:hypothetical protein
LLLWWVGYIVTFTQVLTIIKCIIHEFTSLTILLHFPSPDYWSSFNKYHFYIYLHVYTFYFTVFTLLPFPLRIGFVLPSNFVGEKKRKDKTESTTF